MTTILPLRTVYNLSEIISWIQKADVTSGSWLLVGSIQKIKKPTTYKGNRLIIRIYYDKKVNLRQKGHRSYRRLHKSP